MAIDDPIAAAKAQIAADERSLPSPLVQKIVLSITSLLPEIPGARIKERMESALGKREMENRDYFLQVLADELSTLQIRIRELDERQQKFVQDEFPGLMLEGVRRAKETITRQRIRRLASILSNSVKIAPAVADDPIEMMRIAVELADEDIVVLKKMNDFQGEYMRDNNGRPNINWVNSSWRELENNEREIFSQGEAISICAKLQSFGLVTSMERIPTTLGLTSVPYALLPKGIRFLVYIEQQCPVVA